MSHPIPTKEYDLEMMREEDITDEILEGEPITTEYTDNISDKVEAYHKALEYYAQCAAQENFSKQETIKARAALNIAEIHLRDLRYDINDLVVAKTQNV